MNYPIRIGLRAGADIEPFRILKPGSADHEVVQAAAAADANIFVSSDRACKAGGHLDVVVAGVAPVDYAGNIAAGAPVTANAEGKAVAATTGNRIVGFAVIAGANGDRGSVLISPGIA